MDQDVTMALAVIRQELAMIKSALGVHRAADAEAVIQRIVLVMENQGDTNQAQSAAIQGLDAARLSQAASIFILSRDVAILSGIIAATHPVTTHGSLACEAIQVAVTTVETLSTHGGLVRAPYIFGGTIVPVTPVTQGSLMLPAYGITGTTTQAILEVQGKVASGVYGMAGAVTIGAVT